MDKISAIHLEQKPRVVFVPELGAVEVVGADGEVMSPLKTIRPKQALGRLAFDFSEMYLETTPGTYTPAELEEQTGFYASFISNLVLRAKGLLPEELIRVDNSNRKVFSVTLGDFVLSSRAATPEDIEAVTPRAPAQVDGEPVVKPPKSPKPREETYEERIARTLETDPHKLDLTQHDHAIIRIGETCYSLQLQNAQAIMAARVIQQLSLLPEETDEVGTKQLARAIWEDMPLTERMLYTERERELYGKGDLLYEPARSVLANVTTMLNVTSRFKYGTVVREASYAVKTHDLDIVFAAAPRQEEDDIIALIPIYAPGSIIEQSAEGEVVEISAEEVQQARDILRQVKDVGQFARLADQDAVAILDFVMTREGKLALQRALQANRDLRAIEDVIKEIHEAVRHALGAGYAAAWRNRLIAGNRFTGEHSVNLVSGRLPGTTKRWVFGAHQQYPQNEEL